MKLPKPPFGSESTVSNFQIREVPVIMDISNPISSGSQTFQVGVESLLYCYILAHFQNLSRLLDKAEQEVKEHGVRILRLLNSLSVNIYEELGSSNIDFPVLNGNNDEIMKFSKIKIEPIYSDYAGSIFLMIIGESEDEWPNKVN